jgi:hypothetical protein
VTTLNAANYTILWAGLNADNTISIEPALADTVRVVDGALVGTFTDPHGDVYDTDTMIAAVIPDNWDDNQITEIVVALTRVAEHDMFLDRVHELI